MNEYTCCMLLYIYTVYIFIYVLYIYIYCMCVCDCVHISVEIPQYCLLCTPKFLDSRRWKARWYHSQTILQSLAILNACSAARLFHHGFCQNEFCVTGAI